MLEIREFVNLNCDKIVNVIKIPKLLTFWLNIHAFDDRVLFILNKEKKITSFHKRTIYLHLFMISWY
jgi:hypothetical protein